MRLWVGLQNSQKSISFSFSFSLSNAFSHYQGCTCSRNGNQLPLLGRRSRTQLGMCRAQLSEEILVQLLHNKVLIAAGVSGGIGQLCKPWSNVILYGKHFDFKTAFQPGGFPSTHSSALVAAATCLGLERGFPDSLFGITAVYAGLIMYDAQGQISHVDLPFNSIEHTMRDVEGAGCFVICMLMGQDTTLGQMSSWGATVITSLASALPVVGDTIATWLWGGFSVDNANLNHFFSLQHLLPFILVGASLLHLVALRQYGSKNPLGVHSEMDKPLFIGRDTVEFLHAN